MFKSSSGNRMEDCHKWGEENENRSALKKEYLQLFFCFGNRVTFLISLGTQGGRAH